MARNKLLRRLGKLVRNAAGKLVATSNCPQCDDCGEQLFLSSLEQEEGSWNALPEFTQDNGLTRGRCPPRYLKVTLSGFVPIAGCAFSIPGEVGGILINSWRWTGSADGTYCLRYVVDPIERPLGFLGYLTKCPGPTLHLLLYTGDDCATGLAFDLEYKNLVAVTASSAADNTLQVVVGVGFFGYVFEAHDWDGRSTITLTPAATNGTPFYNGFEIGTVTVEPCGCSDACSPFKQTCGGSKKCPASFCATVAFKIAGIADVTIRQLLSGTGSSYSGGKTVYITVQCVDDPRVSDPNPPKVWLARVSGKLCGVNFGMEFISADSSVCPEQARWTILGIPHGNIVAPVSDISFVTSPGTDAASCGTSVITCTPITQCRCCMKIGDTMHFSYSAAVSGSPTSGSGYVLLNNASGSATLTWDGTSFKGNNGGTPGVPLYKEFEVTYNGEVDEDGVKKCAWGWSVNIDDWGDATHTFVSRAALSSGSGRGTCGYFTETGSVQAPGPSTVDVSATMALSQCNNGGVCIDGTPGPDGTCP